jgi:hypothetical protein
LPVPNPFHQNPLRAKEFFPPGIMLLLTWETVAKAVRFQCEPGFRTIKIQGILPDGMLAPEFVA